MSDMLDHCNACGRWFVPVWVEDPNVLYACDEECGMQLSVEFPDDKVVVLTDKTLMVAAAEYADLIENSEQIWWCIPNRMEWTESGCGGGHGHLGCGWWTLTPTNKQQEETDDDL